MDVSRESYVFGGYLVTQAMDLLRASCNWMIFALLLSFALAGIGVGWLLKSNGSSAKSWATILASGGGLIARMAALLRLLCLFLPTEGD